MEWPEPEQVIHVEGPEGQSVFHRLLVWCLPQPEHQQLQAWLDRMSDYIRGANDDRALVVVGALVVENAIDQLLGAMMPGYKSLRESRDFTVSLKVELAKSLRLIPSWILDCADLCRKIRNEFAHDLELSSFGRLGGSLLADMHAGVQRYNPKPFRDESEAFRVLVSFTAAAIWAYGRQVALLRDYLDSPAMGHHLRSFAQQKTPG